MPHDEGDLLREVRLEHGETHHLAEFGLGSAPLLVLCVRGPVTGHVEAAVDQDGDVGAAGFHHYALSFQVNKWIKAIQPMLNKSYVTLSKLPTVGRSVQNSEMTSR